MAQVTGNVVVKAESMRKKMVRLQRALLDAVTGEDISAIAQKLLEKAKEGSVAAAKLVFGYVFGRPDKSLALQAGRQEQEPEEVAEAIVRSVAEGKPLDAEMEAVLKELFAQRDADAGRRTEETPQGANGLNGGGRRK